WGAAVGGNAAGDAAGREEKAKRVPWENRGVGRSEKGCGAGGEGHGVGLVRLQDEELASLRPARWFMHIFEEEVPKTPAEIEQHLSYYSLTDTPLPPLGFDRLLFTNVYCAYQVRSTQGLDKNLWISFFSQLVDEIFRDLCKGLCPVNTTLLLASWPWKEKPSHLASLKHFYHSNLARTKRDT
uniref:F180B protein n=1 Tax=Strigops habroptila TaxID=2489341 RepID=A0A672TM04_STRHB